MKHLQIKADTPLENKDLKTLVTGLKGFLETCRLTPESKAYLKYNPEMAQVIEKL